MNPTDLHVLEQPELPVMASLPEREDLVEMVRARSFLPNGTPKRFKHSGKIVVKRLRNNEELATLTCLLLRAGVSQRLVAIRTGISTNSVGAIVEAMRNRGELESVRLRVDRVLDRFVEVGLERVVDGILHGEIHPGQLTIPVLAAYDKKAQRDAGMVVGTQRTVTEVTVDQVMAAYRLARESQSLGSVRKALPLQGVVELDTVQDTAPTAATAAAPPCGQGAPGVGGGVAAATAATSAEGNWSKFRTTKEASEP